MLIKRDQDTIRSYFEDSSNLKGGYAEEVAFPENIKELAEILKKANSGKMPVSISGGGTGTTGSRIPFGGIVISMERFNKIIDISREKMTATLEAGVLVDDFARSCEKQGLFYPCHPTEKTAFVGGTLATNASGSRSFKYGPTRNYTRALRMLLSDGSCLDIVRGESTLSKDSSELTLAGGGVIKVPLASYKMPNVKNSAGYFAKEGMDPIDLFIGQEGTLSVIVELEMGLVKRPPGIFGCFVFFKSVPDSWHFSSALKTEPDILSIEYFDSNSLGMLGRKTGHVPRDAASAVFFERELREGREGPMTENLEGLILRHNASLDDTWAAVNEKDVNEFSEFRHYIPEAINEIVRARAFPKYSTDIAVPADKFLEMMNFYTSTFAEAGIEHAVFGHIGENHVHTNLLPKSDGEATASREICLELVKKGVALGGTVSAEHGIGKTRHRYLEIMYGEKGIAEMVKVKKALDPACILGLGNIFPKEALNLVFP